MPDLSDRAVNPGDFPAGGASRVPDPALPDVLADITGHPGSASVVPASCRPGAVISSGAVVLLAPGAQERSTYTAAIVYSPADLAQLGTQLDECRRWTTGTATASTRVTAEVLPAPSAPDGVETLAVRRTMVTGAIPNILVTSTVTLIGQRDDVRVYAEYRWPSAGPLPPDAGSGLDALFTKAVDAAFG